MYSIQRAVLQWCCNRTVNIKICCLFHADNPLTARVRVKRKEMAGRAAYQEEHAKSKSARIRLSIYLSAGLAHCFDCAIAVSWPQVNRAHGLG